LEDIQNVERERERETGAPCFKPPLVYEVRNISEEVVVELRRELSKRRKED
jgi:hypothetical protein